MFSKGLVTLLAVDKPAVNHLNSDDRKPFAQEITRRA
jgi:hypothetical protein